MLLTLLAAVAATTPGAAHADPASPPAARKAAGTGNANPAAGKPVAARAKAAKKRARAKARKKALRQRVPVVSSALVFTSALEPYARYQPQTRCRPKSKPGVLLLAAALTARGGGTGPIGRSCAGSSTSEHKEGRAFDWMLDASVKADRRTAKAFLDEIFAPDHLGNPHALARRMGIMYVIWNDRIYSAYDGFSKRPYLSSGCRTKRRCSPTLRHRDHVHISLTRKAARGRTSWYLEQPTG